MEEKFAKAGDVLEKISRVSSLESFVTVWGKLFSLPGALGPALRARRFFSVARKYRLGNL